jgi:hypothetical protein
MDEKKNILKKVNSMIDDRFNDLIYRLNRIQEHNPIITDNSLVNIKLSD